MCHSWVKLILRWDKQKQFLFAPLESEKAKEILLPIFPGYLAEDTIVYYADGKVFIRSNAVIAICRELKFPFNLGVTGSIIPQSIRDNIYKFIARNRHRYGERFESCPLPPEEWRDRFIF